MDGKRPHGLHEAMYPYNNLVVSRNSSAPDGLFIHTTDPQNHSNTTDPTKYVCFDLPNLPLRTPKDATAAAQKIMTTLLIQIRKAFDEKLRTISDERDDLRTLVQTMDKATDLRAKLKL